MATSDSVTVTEEKTDEISDEIGGEVVKRVSTFGFDEKTTKTDLTLLVEDKKIYVTRVVLELLSPAFEKIVSEQLQDGEEIEVKIHGKTFEDFVEFLACIYPGKMCRVTMNNVFSVVRLAREFDIDFLVEKCESVLIDELSTDGVDESFVVRCGNTAIQYDLLSLKQKSLDDIGKRRLAEIHTLDKELLLEDKGRLMVYEKILPSLRSEACRNRYISAGRKCPNSINLKLFTDAQYKGLDFTLEVDKDKTSYRDEIVIWDVTCKIDVKKEKSSTTINVTAKGKNLPSFFVILKVVVKNNDPQCPKGDFCNQKCVFVSGLKNNPPMDLRIYIDLDEIKDMKYRLNGVYTMSAHILMNKPDFS